MSGVPLHWRMKRQTRFAVDTNLLDNFVEFPLGGLRALYIASTFSNLLVTPLRASIALNNGF